MVIFKINKGMTREEYLEYSRGLVQQYEWCRGQDKCLVVPEYVEVYVVNNEQEYFDKSPENLLDELLDLVGDKRK